TKSNSAGLSFTQSPLKKVPELYLNRAEADYALRRLRLWFPSHWQSHLRARPHHRPWEDSQTQEEALEEISGGIWAHTSVRRRRDPVEMPAARDRNWAYGRLPVMEEVKREAERRKIALLIAPTSKAIQLIEKDPAANAILHVTC